ncbi:adenylate kinase family protein [Candidatus Woesearchaeota archaeon]|nr:adenylate kinase family protein [Candidatus Woesearchaeota archaeon]
MVIIVTGCPATGKTIIARKIAEKKKLRYIDVNQLIKDNKLYSYYSRKDMSYVVDVKKLNRFLIKLIKKDKDVVLDSHLSHYLPNKYVDECIVTKCSLKELKKRLEKRKYPNKKIRDNLDCEIFDVCHIEALENKHKVRIIDTSDKKTF